MDSHPPFAITHSPLYIVPILHYTMECAAEVARACKEFQPDCIAVELPETLQEIFFRGIERLPDISVITSRGTQDELLCYLIEPCDASYEAIRYAQEKRLPAYCIDLDIAPYPYLHEPLPDPYAITRIGLKNYYEAYKGALRPAPRIVSELDTMRELYMAKRLKELSFTYERILVVVGMAHAERVLLHFHDKQYPTFSHAQRKEVTLGTLTEEACRQGMNECGWISSQYEKWRDTNTFTSSLLDRQENYLLLLKGAISPYEEEMRSLFPAWGLSTIFKFCRNWAHLQSALLPTIFQLITSAKGCINHNFAYEVWKLATEYPFLKNIDSFQELPLTPEELWGNTKRIQFHLKNHSEKSSFEKRLSKEKSKLHFLPPSPFSLCSYPPEDSVIEHFGEYLKKKAISEQQEHDSKTVPFSTSLEEGIDIKETLRHLAEKKLYVRTQGKPPGLMGSCVVIFDEDLPKKDSKEIYPWKLTWLGENHQESDMAFYATEYTKDVIGPGIARCEYGGFMLTHPPQRVFDVWHDPDYKMLSSKAEVLLAAAIDYAVKPVTVYMASRPPSFALKQYAARRGKKVLYIPLGSISPLILKKLRIFHVLEGYDKRNTAGEYIH